MGSGIDVVFRVSMVPEPAPRPRARVIPGPKPRAQIYTPKKARQWKADFAAAASRHLPGAPLDEALRVDALFLMPRPQRLLRPSSPEGLVWHRSKPDRDNLDKNLLDALAPFWRDDTDISVGTILKAYHAKSGHPEVVVRIRSADALDPQRIAQQLGLLPPTRAAARVTEDCPTGVCAPGCVRRNFGALQPLPDGYSVWWHEGTEMWQAHGPAGWSSAICCDPYLARRWCFEHAIDSRDAALCALLTTEVANLGPED